MIYVQLVSTSIPNYLSPRRYREPTPVHGVTSAGEKGNLFGSGSAWRVLGDSSCTVSAGGIAQEVLVCITLGLAG